MVAAIVVPSVLTVTLIGLVFMGGLRFRMAAYPGLILLARLLAFLSNCFCGEKGF